MKNEYVKEQLQNKFLPGLQETLEAISDGIAICDCDSKFVMVNNAFCNMLQTDRDTLIGRKTELAVKKRLYNKSLVNEVIKTKTEICDVLTLRSGAETMAHCKPIFDDNGNLHFVVSTSTNILELDQLRKSVEYERMKSDAYLREVKYLRKQLSIESDFICESPNMKTILQTLEKIAPTDCTVFITGETGVGKEVVAKLIHTNSSRKNAPFIPVSISAIPENLLEAELFGYEEGAFTGAVKGGRIGFFEIAQNGTLFLDEIAEIPAHIQIKLLRAIETMEVVRIGGRKSTKLNVRIITATNKDMELAIRKGFFREDLYYRLNVIPLTIKPLRKRKEDILPFCLHFLDKLNIKYGIKKMLSNSAIKELNKYDWPGNIRELKNCIERLAMLSNQDIISTQEIESLMEKRVVDDQSSDSIWNIYKSTEKNKILEALSQAQGNKSKAAKILGIPRSKLYRKLDLGLK